MVVISWDHGRNELSVGAITLNTDKGRTSTSTLQSGLIPVHVEDASRSNLSVDSSYIMSFYRGFIYIAFQSLRREGVVSRDIASNATSVDKQPVVGEKVFYVKYLYNDVYRYFN